MSDTPTRAVESRWPPRRLIMDRAGQNLYLTRYFLLGNRETRYALYLHEMHLPDDDACHHDHPWSFLTLVLRGGYIEDVTLPDGSIRTRHNRPGMLLFRPAEHTHRIRELPKRSWGFHTPDGWVHWKTFIALRNAMAWCDDWLRRPEKEPRSGSEGGAR